MMATLAFNGFVPTSHFEHTHLKSRDVEIHTTLDIHYQLLSKRLHDGHMNTRLVNSQTLDEPTQLAKQDLRG